MGVIFTVFLYVGLSFNYLADKLTSADKWTSIFLLSLLLVVVFLHFIKISKRRFSEINPLELIDRIDSSILTLFTDL